MVMTSTFSANSTLIRAPHPEMRAPARPIQLSFVHKVERRIRFSRGLGTFGWRCRLRAGFGALVLMPVLAVYALGQTPDPVQFVVAFNKDVSAQLGSTAIDPDERKRRFAALVDKDLDLDVIGEHLLGWRWTNAAPVDRQAFRREFRNYLIQTFAAKVTGLGDGRMTVTSVVQGDSSILVLTEVTDKLPARELFAWRLVHAAAGWRVCDVVVNNVSMTAIMRSQFDSVLREGVSDLGPLDRLLHERSQE
jgi:phospholipid transport system substrate-binding protein